MRRVFVFAVALCLAAGQAVAQDNKHGLKPGTPDIKSAGALAFGPGGILFVGDTQQAAIFAIETGDKAGDSSAASYDVKNAKEAIAGLLGTSARDVTINDLAVNPQSGNVFLSVARGSGPDAVPAVLKLEPSGKFSEISLKNVPFAKAALPNAPNPGGEGKKNARANSITDLAYVDGRVFIAGLSNEEFASTLRSIPFPFGQVDRGAGIEIFHGAHGKIETASPIRTFTPFTIKGEAHLLAAYTCTPLVKLRVSELTSGNKVKGTTIAELGNRNNPLDIIVYQRDGKDYLLIANTSRGVMKVTTDKISEQSPITAPVSGTAGLSYETVAEMKGVSQLDKLNDRNAVLLVVDESGATSLKSVALP
jgi:hypothetical protein